MHKTYKTYKTYKIMMGAPCDTQWVCLCRCLVWLGGKIYRWGVPGNLMAAAVCLLRWRGACV